LILPLGTQLTCPDQWAGNVPPENGRRCSGIDARRSTSLPAAFACSVPSATAPPDGFAAQFWKAPAHYHGPVADQSEPAIIPPDRRPRRQSSPLARVGFVVFGIGLLGVAVIMVAFATGSHDLPLWLNLVAMLAPVGFGIGLIGVYREARASRPSAAVPTGPAERTGSAT
jgi:hypothetical protein